MNSNRFLHPDNYRKLELRCFLVLADTASRLRSKTLTTRGPAPFGASLREHARILLRALSKETKNQAKAISTMASTASPIPIQLMVRSFSLKARKPTNAAIVTNAALKTGIKKLTSI